MNLTKFIAGLSIKHRIIATAVISSAIALALSATLIIVGDHLQAKKRLMHSATVLSNIVGYNAGAALAFSDKIAAQDSLSMFGTFPHVIQASIISNEGVQFGLYESDIPRHIKINSRHSGNDTSAPGHLSEQDPETHSAIRSVENFLDYSAPIFFDDVQQGIFFVRIDLKGIQTRSISLSIAVFFSFIFSIFLVYALSSRLQRLVTKPIHQLAKACNEVSENKNYSLRLQNQHGIELELLSESFNSMLQAIENRDRESEDLVKELRAATEAKSAFLANMSHEIRTPLNGILGVTSLLESEADDNQRHNYYKTIDNSANALLLIINDILDLSRIETGKFEIDSTNFELDKLAQQAHQLFEPTSREKGVGLQYSVAEKTSLDLVGDPRRISQVLINLVGNALKFTEKGKVTFSISAQSSTQQSTNIIFLITDTGIGIQEHDQKNLFEDFSQVDGTITRRFGGSGLGLSISKKIVDLLGGEIGMTSKLGEGSSFWFKIPLETQQNSRLANAGQGQANRNKPSTESMFSGKNQYQGRVLVADDSEVNQFIMVETLKNFGLEAVSVSSGGAAIEAAKSEMFDLIFMDIQMPDIGGIEACKEIRNLKTPGVNFGRIPIIAFSASAMSGDKERFIQAGMDDYLSKPMRTEDLQSILEKWLIDSKPVKQPSLKAIRR